MSENEHLDPIEFANCVQQHGLLFVLRANDPALTILQVSANSEDLLQLSPQRLLGRSFFEVIDTASQSNLLQALQEPLKKKFVPLRSTNHIQWNGAFYYTAGGLVLELDPALEHALTALSLFNSVHGAIDRMNVAEEEETLYEIFADEVCNLLGYDRALVFHFQESGHGKVVGDAHKDWSLEKLPLKGSLFPPESVPANSRCLFLRNSERLIVDVSKDPVPIIPALNPVTGSRIDLTHSILRGVSSCHAKYVRSMKVKSTFVQSIMINKDHMWGFVICHHYTEKHVPYEQRAACRQIVQAFSLLLVNRSEAEYRKYEQKASRICGQILNVATHDPKEDLMSHVAPIVKNIMSCDGLAFISPSSTTTVGLTPSLSSLTNFSKWLLDNNGSWATRGVWQTQCVDKLPVRIPEPNGVCGVLALPISDVSQELIFWFRAGHKQCIQWRTTTSNMDGDMADVQTLTSPMATDHSHSPSPHGAAAPLVWFSVWRDPEVNFSRKWENSDIASARQLQLLLRDLRAVNEMRLRSRLLSEFNMELDACNKHMSRVAADLSRLVETVPLPIFATDVHLRITDWNPSAESHMGWKSQEVLGYEFVSKVVEVKCQEQVRKVLLQALTGERTPELEFHAIKRSNVAKNCFLLRVAPRLDVQGNVIGLLGVCEDSSGKSEGEATKLLCSVSHEMRTPLNGILGMLQLALDADLSSEVEKCLKVALKSGEHLLSVISDVLDMGQIEAGKVHVKFAPTDITTVVDDAVSIVSSSIRSIKDVSITRIIRRESLPNRIYSDASRVRQVLVNLISNGVKYSKEGIVSVEVDANMAERRLRLVVQDQGIGMRESDVKNLFSRFVRVRDERINDPGGTGLGLVICKMIVEMLGGHIDVKSVFGTGTTVTVSLPLVEFSPTSSALPPPAIAISNNPALMVDRSSSPGPDPDLGTRRSQGPSLSPTSEHIRRPSPLRILLVEDNELNMLVARTMLERQGHIVEMAINGKEAVDMFFTTSELAAREDLNPYDLVLMDVEMPLMNGLEACRRIRQIECAEGLGRTPILALSAHALPEQENACMESGMDGYVTKPIIRKKLFEAINSVLSR
mmetsp:Transcript_33211/g.55948  ORF Transcript_33211/g.55948 Transcript_33211/m.55948 type:complete len:1085 (-) Transcript_33211:1039-4293(-)|eukprot:CAMPEP_0184343550 /NCGR_PEP_ID=MMETSP1089-20130417/12056_1 /TAXON_ID=38269 ORGANISM="Gloeochaete wittrockiana, Strain SAG46.84" /NCGR_SAMPLE_ID=MMETSP1089 /ASSEMBLY_ACC=CAM_ASM_000445 /LENGTH=1084 /DNA_ID=CAMNT_0026672895 /DNA_START=167 /DNA_END=3421 /DNA_ORIENTATION=-